MSQEVVPFDSESLRADMQAAFSGGSPETPVESAPPEPPAEQPAAPVAEPSAAEPSAPQQLAEGSTPPGDSQPAVDESQFADLKRAAEMVGIDYPALLKLDASSRESVLKMAQSFLGANNRAGEMGRELKALKRAVEIEPEQTEDVYEQTVQAQPEQPAQLAPDIQTVIEQHVAKLADQDQECRAFAAQYHETRRAIGSLVSKDERGNYVGELPDLDRQLTDTRQDIRTLESYLDPERAKRLGVTVDEINAADVRLNLANLRSQALELTVARSERIQLLRELQERQEQAKAGYSQGRERIKGSIVSRYEAQKREAERDEKVKQGSVEFEKEWKGAFASEVNSQKVPAELKSDLWEYLKASALSVPVVENPKQFVADKTKAFLGTVDKYHRLQAKTYANLKTADAAPPSPTGPGSIAAPPSPNTNRDWEAELAAEHSRVRFG